VTLRKAMTDWISSDKSIHVDTCVIIKRHRTKYGRWEYNVMATFKGEWNDLVYELYETYDRFYDEVGHLSKRSAIHDRLDKIAEKLKAADEAYEFMLPDKTDDWYVAYVKPAIFRIDADGSLR
jgi:hypothetical protein